MAVTRKIYALIVVAIIVATFSTSAVAQLPIKKPGSIREQIEKSTLFNGEQVDSLISDMLDFASKFKGVRYSYGATGPKRFDCSGFTSYVYSKVGVKLHRTSREQVRNGRVIALNELQPGDLVFFNGRRAGGDRIGHVGIVTSADNENSTFEFIHASISKGVTVSKSTETYFLKRYVKACRIIDAPEEEEIYGDNIFIDFGLAEQEDLYLNWFNK